MSGDTQIALASLVIAFISLPAAWLAVPGFPLNPFHGDSPWKLSPRGRALLACFLAAGACLPMVWLGFSFLGARPADNALNGAPLSSAAEKANLHASRDNENPPAPDVDVSKSAGIQSARGVDSHIILTKVSESDGELVPVTLEFDQGGCEVRGVSESGADIPIEDPLPNFASIRLRSGFHELTITRKNGTTAKKSVRVRNGAKTELPVSCDF